MSQSPPDAERPGFKQTQYGFAAHIRNPDTHPAPENIEDRRIAIYRDLFYNNIAGFAEAGFPILHAITPEEKWHGMIRDFMVRHRCHTPYFPKLSQEFLDYLKNTRQPQDDDPPFLIELAHYEWIETALDIDETRLENIEVDTEGDLIAGIPILSPLAWPLQYRFPVHRISADFQPRSAPETPTFLLVYRNRNDDVGFMELNPVTFRLLEILNQNPDMTGRLALKQIVEELNHPQPDVVYQGGQQSLQQLRDRDIVLGTRRPPK